MPPRLSIVTPVRNNLATLKACVASVARAAMELPIEHVVVDGASTDGTPEWLATMGEDLPALSWVSRPDSGLYEALNRGVLLSSAPLILHLNADEQLLPKGFTALVEHLERRQATDLAFGNYLLALLDGAPLAARIEIPARRWYLRHGVNYVLSCATVFRRALWERTGPFDTSLRLLADKDWYLRALENGARFDHLNSYVSLFTVGRDNLSRDSCAAAEQAEVRRRHGAYAWHAMRLVARSCRIVEKALRGAYMPRRVCYPFIDAAGQTRRIEERVGPRWRWR